MNCVYAKLTDSNQDGQAAPEKLTLQENRLRSKAYGAALQCVRYTFKHAGLSPMFLQVSTLLSRVARNPGPALLLAYILYWLQPKNFKDDDDPHRGYIRLPRSGKTHADRKHWMFNTYAELGAQLGYPRARFGIG